MNLKEVNILITGGTGFLGKHIVDIFRKELGEEAHIQSIGSKKYDLRNFRDAEKATEGIDLVVHLAATAGGIGFNQKYPGKMFYENMAMGINIIEACRKNGVKKAVMISTICVYPKYTTVPFNEKDLFDGYPEETNAPYGVAKRSLLVMAQAYRKQYGSNIIYLMPVNLYGIGDSGFFDTERAHVIPDLVRKFIEAKEKDMPEVVLWGSGKPTREFLNVKDAARGIFLASKMYDKPEPINIGAGFEISIKELAEKIKELVNYDGIIVWDISYPDGQPRRCLNVEKAAKYFNFVAEIDFNTGLEEVIEWYLKEKEIALK